MKKRLSEVHTDFYEKYHCFMHFKMQSDTNGVYPTLYYGVLYMGKEMIGSGDWEYNYDKAYKSAHKNMCRIMTGMLYPGKKIKVIND